MKILKMIALLIALAIAVAIGVAYYTASKLDGYVKRSIENYASQSLGTQVTVGEVNLSLRQTQATIRNLEVANPPGFEGAHAFKAGNIEIVLNPKESKLDSVVIDRVLLSQPNVRYVKTKDSDNLSVLQNNAKQYSAVNQKEEAQIKAGTTSKDTKQPRILIKCSGRIRRSREVIGKSRPQIRLPPPQTMRLLRDRSCCSSAQLPS